MSVEHCVLKFLAEFNGMGIARRNTQSAKSAHVEVINVFIQNPFGSTILSLDTGRDHFNRPIGANAHTAVAGVAGMVIVLIVNKNQFTFEIVLHLQGIPVFRIFLRDNSTWFHKISSRHPQSPSQGRNALYDFTKVLSYVL
jgi:hypothetical protein